MIIKSYRIRLYPTREQEQNLWNHIGSCRFVWNYMLSYQQDVYEQGGKYLSGFSMINLLKPLKNDGEHQWLYEVSNSALCRTCRDVDEAYKRFFKKLAGHPKFKSRKRAKPSYPVRETVYFKDNFVTIEKIGKIKYKTDFILPQGRGHKFSNPRITYVDNKWILSFGLECESQVPKLTDISMGIDLGVKDLAIAEFQGEKLTFHNINKSSKMKLLNRQMKHIQRSISRKYEANHRRKTKNIEKAEAKLRKLHKRISDIRNNYIHQTTHTLVSMLPKRVVMEDLNVKGMMKNRHLSKAIAEQCFHEFVRQMKYKCEWNGIDFVQVGRFYPSSKTCSACGNVKADLKLSDRTYKCDKCGLVIDRDYNAAINLSRYIT